MPEEDNKIIEKISELGAKIDKKALAGAAGLMMLSWGALPIVYWLLVRQNNRNDKPATPAPSPSNPSPGGGGKGGGT